MRKIIFMLSEFEYIWNAKLSVLYKFTVMPKISEKAGMMPASPIRKLVPYAEAAKRRGVKVYHLNIGQPDIHTPEIALNAVKNMDLKVIEYTHSAGNESYRRKLAESYRKIGIDIDHTEMIVPVRSFIKDDFALPSIDEIEKKITPKTKAILICNPNNPTGALYSKEELMKLGEIVKKHKLFLFSDEVYREFCYGAEHFSVMQLEGIRDNAVLLDSVSKRYSMCGVRIGALITHNKEILAAALKFAQARLCPPELGQLAAEAALDTPKEYFREVYDEYIARRDFMVNALNQMPGVYCPLPRGAFYTVVKLPIDDADRFAQWLLEDFNYKNQTVMVAPATGFYFTPGAGKNELRVAYVLKIDDLRNAMETLAEALKVYPGRVD